ncbi:MAG: ferritin [Lentisphaeria bacterium]|nr:ferritin [Lentisphaeria bacterium]
MLCKEVASALNTQITKEFESAYIYLAMSLRCKTLGLDGAANWLNAQYQEEMSHVDKFCDYMNMQGADIELGAIAKPKNDYQDLKEIFTETLAHEQSITKSIHELVYVAREHKDYSTEVFLQWYVAEQVEEESNVMTLIDKLKMTGTSGSALYMLDKELATRVFVPVPTA